MNLYAHFPFCKSKCAYCALRSRAGSAPEERAAHVAGLAHAIASMPHNVSFDTVYFGGGSPATCNLDKVLEALAPHLAPNCEFTVELHPSNVSHDTLAKLSAGGVNRISMGVQSLDDNVLASMGRTHTAQEAEEAFLKIRSADFSSAGIDLIAGWPSADAESWKQTISRAIALAPEHMSIYSLIREPGTPLDRAIANGSIPEPSEADALDALRLADSALADNGFVRYEISNWARPGRECRHNLAVWRGEDYLGIGEGAHGRIGRTRTMDGKVAETLSEEADATERALFALRTAEGLSLRRAARLWPVLATHIPKWRSVLDFNVEKGLLQLREEEAYAPTPRGAEVCDAIISDVFCAM